MAQPNVVIIGGGLAGLSAGCYARASGFRTQIVEHRALGGVCTAWQRGRYVIDGCIQWLTGGPFARVYEELGILDQVPLRTIHHFTRLQDREAKVVIDVTADLDALRARLTRSFPADAAEIERLVHGARQIAELSPMVDRAPDLATWTDGLRYVWQMRHELGAAAHFRKPLAQYAAEHLSEPELRRFLTLIMPREVPALFLLLMLGYLARGWLSRPVGGSAAFRDALVRSYGRLGGESRVGATVEEVLIEGHRARGVRLADGSWIDADAVISTSSVPETVYHLLGGRYDAAATAERLRTWTLFSPIVLASFGIALPLRELPQMLVIDGVAPFEIGGVPNRRLSLRICNEDDGFAPPGHSVVQAIAGTDYAWWARLGAAHAAERDRAGQVLLDAIDRSLPGVGISSACRMTDVATPVTYWTTARSWRGAYEGWLPSDGSMPPPRIPHRVTGLAGMYMAGQWVEPGGGVPLACTSGRQAVQVLCADRGVPFVVPPPSSRRR
ncbi:MAG TPA: NAD(P)/FAD-dependent oxidoreductase [Polyangiaceae bacterium]|nr:NAD(P)/FAD-dependent oxidoreductase [Polyangiaceae bacterium]